MGLTEEQVNAIIEANEETITGLKGEIEKYQTASEEAEKKLSKAQKELSTLKEDAEKNADKNPYKVKYDALKEEFNKYKADVDAKATKATKEDAYRALLKECGVADKRIPAVVKVADIDSIELDEEGKIKNADALKSSIKEEWSDFIPTEGTMGAKTATPPANSGGKMSKEDILAIKDTAQRQQAMLENKDLFI
jgi:predicted  nucleic acid-binding Zn-ribbon protein